MKQEQNADNSASGNEEVFRCMTCGAIIGYYEPGSAGTTKCPSCKEEISDNVSTFFCKYCGQKLEWNRPAIGSEQNG